MVPLGWRKWLPELKIYEKQALQGLLSLLVFHILSLWGHHMVFFPCWCFTFFSCGASHGLLSQLVFHILSLWGHHMLNFPCWCFIWSSFPAGVSQFPALKFCHNNQTKWPPFINISQAMPPSLPQAIFLSYAPLQKIAMKCKISKNYLSYCIETKCADRG